MDYIVHGVAKSRTQVSNFHSLLVYHMQSTFGGGEVASSFIPETELSIRVARPWTLADSSMPRSLHL